MYKTDLAGYHNQGIGCGIWCVVSNNIRFC